MTDRELLEAAAKAAGIEHVTPMMIEWGKWDPLNSVGDAASLLLALRLRVDYVGDQPCIEGVLQSGMTAEQAFCRAVVRAAAAMARSEAC